LHWSTPDGCSSCRPALNYYLLCALPGEYVDDQQSRFVNERMHANIQKDGTYSVVPRMWGGITNPRELRAIADVVEKYDAPMVKAPGCPRNCAEATIKDFGVVCVDSGYELHVGGNGGIKVRATDFLCKVTTEQQALDHCAAFIQLYREEAFYLERTAPWIERVGLAYIQARIVEDEVGREALTSRFLYSQ